MCDDPSVRDDIDALDVFYFILVWGGVITAYIMAGEWIMGPALYLGEMVCPWLGCMAWLSPMSGWATMHLLIPWLIIFILGFLMWSAGIALGLMLLTQSLRLILRRWWPRHDPSA